LLNPELLIADEPTSALDVITQMEVMSVLGARQRASNSAMLLIGHDMGLMAQFVDRIAVMLEGEIVEIGLTASIIDAPKHDHTRSLVQDAAELHDGLSGRTTADVQ
jgi:ABC-type dipeptide/oligopeptide/nickel transport system ATPase component